MILYDFSYCFTKVPSEDPTEVPSESPTFTPTPVPYVGASVSQPVDGLECTTYANNASTYDAAFTEAIVDNIPGISTSNIVDLGNNCVTTHFSLDILDSSFTLAYTVLAPLSVISYAELSTAVLNTSSFSSKLASAATSNGLSAVLSVSTQATVINANPTAMPTTLPTRHPTKSPTNNPAGVSLIHCLASLELEHGNFRYFQQRFPRLCLRYH